MVPASYIAKKRQGASFDQRTYVSFVVVPAPPFALQDTLSPFVAEACLAVMPPLPAKAMLSVENVRVCKLLGGSTADSHVVRGMVVQRDTQVCPFVHVPKR